MKKYMIRSLIAVHFAVLVAVAAVFVMLHHPSADSGMAVAQGLWGVSILCVCAGVFFAGMADGD